MTYTCKRTGETFATESMAKSIVSNCDGTPPVAVEQAPVKYTNSNGSVGIDTRARDSGGNLITNQEGSQFWMNAGYTGDEPPMEVKAFFSSADYARDWAGEAIRAYAAANPGTTLSSNMDVVQQYPVTESTAQVWKKIPALAPSAGVTYNTPANSPGSTNEPAYVQKSSYQQSVDRVGSTIGNTVADVKSSVSSYGIYIIGAIIFGVFILIAMRGRSSAGVSA